MSFQKKEDPSVDLCTDCVLFFENNWILKVKDEFVYIKVFFNILFKMLIYDSSSS